MLYRINAQSEVYEEALTEAGIAVSRSAAARASSAARRSGRRCWRCSAPPSASVDASRHDRCRTWCARLLEPLGLTAEPPAGTRARERWEALTALAELVDDEVAQRPQLDLPALLAELRMRADARHPPVVQGVTLASLHAAKGLEWDAVFLVGLADGTLPISHALAHGADSEAGRGGAPAALRRNHQGPSAFGAQLGAGAQPGRTAEPQAVAVPQRHCAADARRPDAEQAAAQPRRRVALPDLQQPSDHAGGDHAAPLRDLRRRHRRGAAAAAQGLAAAHRQGA